MAIARVEQASSRQFTLHHALLLLLSVGGLLLAGCGKKEAPPETPQQPAPQQASSQPLVPSENASKKRYRPGPAGIACKLWKAHRRSGRDGEAAEHPGTRYRQPRSASSIRPGNLRNSVRSTSGV
jgi:hypothetical protein